MGRDGRMSALRACNRWNRPPDQPIAVSETEWNLGETVPALKGIRVWTRIREGGVIVPRWVGPNDAQNQSEQFCVGANELLHKGRLYSEGQELIGQWRGEGGQAARLGRRRAKGDMGRALR